MIKGGLKYIDMKNISITTTKTTIAGVYQAIENAYRKAIVLTNLVIDGVEKHDLIAPVIVGANEYTFVYELATGEDGAVISAIEINDDDEVKLVTL